MKKITLLIVFIASTFLWQINAQVSYYTFSETTGNTFTSISGTGTSLTLGDDAKELADLGFTFHYNGSDYTQVSVSSNGYMRMGDVDASNAFNTLAGTGNYLNLLGFFWEDFDPSTGGNIYKETQGSAPNRIFIIEYNAVPRYGAGGGVVTVQALLYETSNNIEYRYGSSSPSFANASIGFTMDPGNTNNFISVTPGTPATTSTTTPNDALTEAPADGVNYLFTYTPPSCFPPTSLSVTNITTTTADIGWTAGASSETAWEYVVQAQGTGEPSGSGTATTANPTNITGLTAGTGYEFYVRADCTGGDYSSWAGPFNFSTSANPITIPYTQDFEGADPLSDFNISSGAQADASLDANSSCVGTNAILMIGGAVADGWTGTSTGATATNAWTDNTSHQASAKLNVDATGAGAGDLILSFDLKQTYTYGALYSWFRVLVNGTQIGPDYNPATKDADACTTKTLDLTAYKGQTFELEFQSSMKYSSASSSQDKAILDNIDLSLLSCGPPTALMATNITGTTADIGWTSTATAWEYVVQTAGTGAPTGSGTTTNVNPTNITGLTGNTDYEVYVRSDCGSSQYSDWAGPYNFTTECEVFVPDYTETFDTFTPDCWDEASNGDLASGPTDLGTGSWTAEEFAHQSTSGGGAVNINLYTNSRSDWILSPQFNLSAGGYEVAIDVAVTNYNSAAADTMGSDDMVKLVYTEDGTTWNTLVTWDVNNQPATAGETVTVAVPSTGASVQFGIWATDGATDDAEDYDFHVDNFKVRTPPSCSEPSALTVTNITSSSVDFAWTANSGETDWEYVIQAAGTGMPGGAGTATTSNPVTISNLTENTAYEIYLRANCGGGDFSPWATPINFTTPFTPVVPNYTNDFTTYPGDGWSEAQGALGSPSGTSSGWGTDDFANDTNHANGASAKLNIYGTVRDEYLISIGFDLTGGTFYLNFDIALTEWNNMNATTLGADDYVALLVSDNGGAWNELTRWDVNSTISNTGEAITEIPLTGYSDNVKFAIYGFSDTSNADNDFFVDNFRITTNSTASVQENSIDGFSMYPNPTKDILKLNAKETIQEINVYNLLGQKVMTVKPNLLHTSINIGSLRTGMYVLKVKVADKVGSYRIMKE